MFGDLGARSGRDKHRRGGDVEGVRQITAGANNVNQIRLVNNIHLGRQLAHHLGCGGNLADRFFFDAQTDQEGCGLRSSELTVHELSHQREHLIFKNFAMINGALDGFRNGNGHDETFFIGCAQRTVAWVGARSAPYKDRKFFNRS